VSSSVNFLSKNSLSRFVDRSVHYKSFINIIVYGSNYGEHPVCVLCTGYGRSFCNMTLTGTNAACVNQQTRYSLMTTQFDRCVRLAVDCLLRQEARSSWLFAMTLFYHTPDFRGSRPFTHM